MSAFTKEKIAVFAPMASARVMTTVTVNPGLRQSCRMANLRCCPLSISILLGDKFVLQSLAESTSKTRLKFRSGCLRESSLLVTPRVTVIRMPAAVIGQRVLKSQVMRAIRQNRWHYCLVGFLPVDIRWRSRVRSNHGPSSTTEIYLLHCRHLGEGVGRLCVAGVEPHHLLGRGAASGL